MGPIGCPETSVQNYHSTLRNIREKRRSHLHRGVILKSRIILIAFPRQQWLRKRTSVLRYAHMACLVLFAAVSVPTLGPTQSSVQCGRRESSSPGGVPKGKKGCSHTFTFLYVIASVVLVIKHRIPMLLKRLVLLLPAAVRAFETVVGYVLSDCCRQKRCGLYAV
jgi:hypothetical protein